MHQQVAPHMRPSRKITGLALHGCQYFGSQESKLAFSIKFAMVYFMLFVLTLSMFAGISAGTNTAILLENVDLKVVNDLGEAQKTIYPAEGPYIFRAEIKMTENINSLSSVTLIIDPDGLELSMLWIALDNSISVVNDPHDYLVLHGSQSRGENNGIDTWHIYFALTLNWNFPDIGKVHCKVVSETYAGNKYSDLFQERFTYENDLDFHGGLILKDSTGHSIADGSWVAGKEKLTLSGLYVIFEDSGLSGEPIYPDLDSVSYKLVDETAGNFWLKSAIKGQELQIEAFTGSTSTTGTKYVLTLDNLPDNVEVVTAPSIAINIDAEPLMLYDTYPEDSNTYFKKTTVLCGVYIKDTGGSGIDTASIEYAISIHGTGNYGDWLSVEPAGLTLLSGGTIRASVEAVFVDGDENYIKWRAKDIAGNGDVNGYYESEDTNIKIDVESKTNYPPIIILDQPLMNSEYQETELITFSILDSYDPDGDELAYTWMSNISGTLSNEPFFQSKLSPGLHEITINIDDSYGHSSSRPVTIKVLPVVAEVEPDRSDSEEGLIILEPAGATAGTATAIVIATLYFFGGTEVGKYKLLGAVIPLYSKLTKRMVLDHETRGMIRGYIIANPGDHFTSIKKQIGLKNGTLAYHLKILERENIIKSHRDGIFKRFYPTNAKISPKMVHLSKQELILNTIIENPGVSRKDLATLVGLSRQVVNYHAKGLIQAGLVRSEKYGKRIQYYPNEPMITGFDGF